MTLTNAQRKQLTAVRKLIKSADWADVGQGLALLEASRDPALWAVMEEGISINQEVLMIGDGEIQKRVKAAHRVSVALIVAQQAGWLRYHRSLKISVGKGALDLSGFALPSNITSLRLTGWSVRDFSPLKSLTHLTALSLHGSRSFRDLSFLSALGRLTSLDLSGCYAVHDLRPIQTLTGLHTLNLRGIGCGDDIRALSGLTQLTTLDLSYIKNLSDLSPLSGLTRLTTLDLSWSKSVRDLRPLHGLKQLKHLDLSNGHQNTVRSQAGMIRHVIPGCSVKT